MACTFAEYHSERTKTGQVEEMTEILPNDWRDMMMTVKLGKCCQIYCTLVMDQGRNESSNQRWRCSWSGRVCKVSVCFTCTSYMDATHAHMADCRQTQLLALPKKVVLLPTVQNSVAAVLGTGVAVVATVVGRAHWRRVA